MALTTKQILQMGLMQIRRVAEAKTSQRMMKMDTTGLKASEIEDLRKKIFNVEERKIIQPAFSALNKRINTLSSYTAKGNRMPSSLKALEYSGIKKFATKDLPKAELERQYAAAQQFYASKSSTVKGAKEVEKHFQQATGFEEKFGKKAANAFWDAYHRVEETMAGLVRNMGSPVVLQEVRDEISSSRLELFEELIQESGDDTEVLVDAIYNVFVDKLSETPEPEDADDVFDMQNSRWRR